MINIRPSSSPEPPVESIRNKAPEPPWEAEIDKADGASGSSLRRSDRKAAGPESVQQIVADQQPFIYLVYPNVLEAISPRGVESSPPISTPGDGVGINPSVSRKAAPRGSTADERAVMQVRLGASYRQRRCILDDIGF